MKQTAYFLCLIAVLLGVECSDADQNTKQEAIPQTVIQETKPVADTTEMPQAAIVIKDFPPLSDAVDEAAFKPALEAWVAYANSFIASFKTLTPQETARLLIDQPFKESFPPDPALDKLTEVLSPLI